MTTQLPSARVEPLVARAWLRRVLLGVCSVAGILLAMGTVGDALDQRDPPSDGLIALWLLAEAAAVCVTAPLLFLVLKRRSTAAGLTLALLSPLGAAGPAALVAVILLVSLRSWRIGALAVAGFVVPTAATVLVFDRGEAVALLIALAVTAIVIVLIGMVIGSRRALREQAAREHELVLEQARHQERARIASEMHDTLSHHLSLIALHAGALGRRDDLPPETVRSSSKLVANLSRTAHSELREVLGILHQGPQATTPPPGVESLPQLVEQHRAAGAEIRTELDPVVLTAGPTGRLSEATSRLIARAVRELLANAARHAPGAPVDLVLAATADRVELSARNPLGEVEPTDATPGLGLEGIAERVRLAGGHHEVATDHGHFEVRVSVPW